MRMYRAKSLKNNNWIYGAYFENYDELEISFIIDNCRYSDDDNFDFTGEIVDVKTVGQRIKKGFFEGDILKNPEGKIGEIVLWENQFCLKTKRKNNTIWYMPINEGFLKNKKVIGNIHENPELL